MIDNWIRVNNEGEGEKEVNRTLWLRRKGRREQSAE